MPMQPFPGRETTAVLCLGLHAHYACRPFRVLNDYLGDNAENIIFLDMVSNPERDFCNSTTCRSRQAVFHLHSFKDHDGFSFTYLVALLFCQADNHARHGRY